MLLPEEYSDIFWVRSLAGVSTCGQLKLKEPDWQKLAMELQKICKSDR